MTTPIKERVKAHRQSLLALGLQRVELVVPTGKVDAIRKYASRLRQEAKKPSKAHLAELRNLIREAFEKYRASCLDNISVDIAHVGSAEARIVADALMRRGDSKAFVLGRRIAQMAT